MILFQYQIRGWNLKPDETKSLVRLRYPPVAKGPIMAHVINASEFESKVIQAQGPVMVDFFATWCGPCKMLAPVLDEVSAEVEGKASVYKVDIDQSPELAQRFGIMSVPTILVFENGEVKRSTMGAQPKQNLLALLG